MPPEFLSFMTINGIGDLTGVVGLVITVVGFFVAISATRKAKTAAEQAKEAAQSARDSIRMFETIVDFSAGIATLEEIKRLHRLPDARHILPDRYQATRKLLIFIRNSNITLDDAQSSAIQNALTNLVEMEGQLERSLSSPPSAFKPAKNNAIISSDIDELLAVLTQLKSQNSGGFSDR